MILWHFRAHSYEDQRPDTALENATVIQILNLDTQIKCSVGCSQHPECISFNFCLPNKCSLNKNDVFSPNVELKQDAGCVYVGMLLNFSPLCQENDVNNEIDDSSNPGNCNISLKWRVPHWSEWSDIKSGMLFYPSKWLSLGRGRKWSRIWFSVNKLSS